MAPQRAPPPEEGKEGKLFGLSRPKGKAALIDPHAPVDLVAADNGDQGRGAPWGMHRVGPLHEEDGEPHREAGRQVRLGVPQELLCSACTWKMHTEREREVSHGHVTSSARVRERARE